MPAQTILQYPHPVLKKVCHTVTAIDEAIRGLIDDLIETMREGPGSVGVAAPQIGVTLRVCVIDVSGSRHGKDNNHGLLLMVNPEIVDRSGNAVMREGCMSVPDYTGDVERSTEVRVRFLDGADGSEREITASGFEAVAIQHEMDHLDGILFLDRIVSIKTGLFRRKNYK
ncbi:peptide deformylase [Geobacter sulfurreducens]|jgi:peptide deformylase|uniref:Peptide deformylase n=1 Tax=Geobacter sulfurreducens (strain ATCC 51573 / DSM 12127 / PCA) TaxID=243231 RepID=Q746R2_GEOSL|nr:peptide deformylase [Geobacter sulfurreducens]AAR36846.1 polypeptide formylmethionine deformylase [Geobacter sulfurreducens PCA]ADI86211.1 polypeptide formylmethionine deformylase [Geobacter sulfurreducens KN400]AJY69705.1 peptide deformylase [Geobacter sulfurreducens]QVW35264.1 peptide deformylase [Geobacter sulfurreducens]UAC04101.1 peptide deformylase [Geobacter sulfurreducens]